MLRKTSLLIISVFILLFCGVFVGNTYAVDSDANLGAKSDNIIVGQTTEKIRKQNKERTTNLRAMPDNIIVGKTIKKIRKQNIKRATYIAPIIIDGNAGEWTGSELFYVDAQGDSICGSDADIKNIYTVMDASYAYIMIETYGVPIHNDAIVEIDVDYKPGQHYTGDLRNDIHLNIGFSSLSAWNDDDLDGNMEPYPINGYVTVRDSVMEIQIPLSEIENAAYFTPTFVNMWDYDYQLGGSGCDPSSLPDPSLGTISGRVISDDTGDPIPDLWVSASDYQEGGSWVGGAQTNASGNYTIIGLGAIDYRVSVAGTALYAGEYYDDTYIRNMAMPMTVVSGSDIGGIDFGLATSGSISGIVTSDNTGLPISGMQVMACPAPDGGYCMSAITDATGTYTITGLGPIDYRVGADGNSSYAGEYYDNTHIYDDAAFVTVTSGSDTGGIDFGLAPAGAISGTVVSESTGLPIPNIRVHLNQYDASRGYWTYIAGENTDSNGNYNINVAVGNYKVEANTCSTQGTLYAKEYYNDTLSEDDADEVSVIAGQNTQNIDFSLDLGGEVSGRVTDKDTGLGLSNIEVHASIFLPDSEDDQYMCNNRTDVNGNYTLSGLPEGTYRIESRDDSGVYASIFYDNVFYDHFTPVSISASSTTPGINFSLPKAGSISGRVTDASSSPISNLEVNVIDFSGGDWVEDTSTEADGTYTVTGLAPGNYFVLAGDEEERASYAPEYYDNVNEFSRSLASPVTVASSTDTPDIDFVLDTGGSISGSVTDSIGSPIDGGICIALNYASTGEWIGCADISNGTYSYPGLVSGSYRVVTAPYDSTFGAQYYDASLTYDGASLVNVTVPNDTPNINFTLTEGGTIEGTISYSGSQRGEILIGVFPDDDFSDTRKFSGITFRGYTPTEYVMPGVSVGDWYAAAFVDVNGNFRLDDGEPDGAYAGNPVSITAGVTLSNIDITLYESVDTDGDGIPDDTDNCPCVSNALQIDTDGDGYGNRCDADLNNDGTVNAPDFGMFAFTYGLCEGDVNYNPDANLTADSGDVCVNAPDFGVFAYYYSNPVGYCE